MADEIQGPSADAEAPNPEEESVTAGDEPVAEASPDAEQEQPASTEEPAEGPRAEEPQQEAQPVGEEGR